MKKLFTKEVIIAVITLISLFVLYSGLNYLKGVNIFKPTNHFYVVMQDVSELQNSSPIYLDGFKVGIVNSINYEYQENGQGQLVVMISLDKQMRLQTGSYVELKSGGKATVSIYGETHDGTYVVNGSKLIVTVSEDGESADLEYKVDGKKLIQEEDGGLMIYTKK